MNIVFSTTGIQILSHIFSVCLESLIKTFMVLELLQDLLEGLGDLVND